MSKTLQLLTLTSFLFSLGAVWKREGEVHRAGGGGGGVRFEVLHKGKAQHCALSCPFAGTQHAPVFLQSLEPFQRAVYQCCHFISRAQQSGRGEQSWTCYPQNNQNQH